MHLLQRGLIGVGVDADVDVELRVPGMAGREPEERPQIELTGDGDVERFA